MSNDNMKIWLRQLRAVSKNSFIVVVGDPVTLIIHLLIIGGVLAIASLPGFSLGGQLKSVRDQALALTFVAGCLLSAVEAAKLVAEDIRKGMIPTIMSRPVSPSALLAGKWLGLLFAEALVMSSATVACLWASRLVQVEHMVETLGGAVYLGASATALVAVALAHYIQGGNYIWKANLTLAGVFAGAFILLNFVGYNGAEQEGYGAMVDWTTAIAYLHMFMALAIFSSLACLFAVEMDVASVLACASVLFFGGLFSGYLLDLVFPVKAVKTVFSVFVPDWQAYWTAPIVSSPLATSFSFNLSRGLNALLQSVLFLAFASFLFEKREITGSV